VSGAHRTCQRLLLERGAGCLLGLRPARFKNVVDFAVAHALHPDVLRRLVVHKTSGSSDSCDHAVAVVVSRPTSVNQVCSSSTNRILLAFERSRHTVAEMVNGMSMRGYAGAVAAVGAATAMTSLIYGWIAPSISLLFFPAVVVPAMYGGYGPGFTATVLATASLAYFFVPPPQSFSIGIDDGVRLAAFAAVSFATAWVGSARRRAEEGQRKSLEELRSVIDTLKQVSGWPIVAGPDMAASVRRMLAHASGVLHAEVAVAVWESDDEPWTYVASSHADAEGIAKQPPSAVAPLIAEPLEHTTFLTSNPFECVPVTRNTNGSLTEWIGVALPGAFPPYLPPGPVASAPFRTEHLTGRLYLAGAADASIRTIPAAEVVAREVGNSLEQIYLAGRAFDLAIREDRLRVSRDLHDGVLQSLTGIRLELQSLADQAIGTRVHDRLLTIGRALASEQRELRLFIDQLKPTMVATTGADFIAARLEEMCSRLSVEWRVPIAVAVRPADLSMPNAAEQALRLMIHEAIVNALKHGHPTRVAVVVDGRTAAVQVTISDDGRGFPIFGSFDHDALVRDNLGPVSLRDRVTALNGRLWIESTASGSRVDFTIPVDREV
jgi:signal transduction histidine kinase